MKKILGICVAVLLTANVFGQINPTVSASSVTFKYCKTTEGTETLLISASDFPYTWHDVICPVPGTYVTTIQNARGCDSIITLTLESYHGFSISNTRRVIFSPGNLQYQANTETWRFAPEQYITLGKTEQNESPSKTSSDWLDIFEWGSGISPFDRYLYYDWRDEQLTWIDWGTHEISGYPADYWYTMRYDEWVFIFYGRNNAKDLYKACNIEGQGGVMVLPDDMLGYVIQDSYTHDEWKAVEAQGAVFLPGGACRTTDRRIHGSTTCYWTPDWTTSSSSYAYLIAVGASSSMYSRESADKQYFYPVRLAHEIVN